METDIERWLSFADRVENKLHTMSHDVYSDHYIAGISNLLKQIRQEAAVIETANLTDKQQHYFKVNGLTQKLRNTAHFANHI